MKKKKKRRPLTYNIYLSTFDIEAYERDKRLRELGEQFIFLGIPVVKAFRNLGTVMSSIDWTIHDDTH